MTASDKESLLEGKQALSLKTIINVSLEYIDLFLLLFIFFPLERDFLSITWNVFWPRFVNKLCSS